MHAQEHRSQYAHSTDIPLDLRLAIWTMKFCNREARYLEGVPLRHATTTAKEQAEEEE
jgi:hypothetical protein